MRPRRHALQKVLVAIILGFFVSVAVLLQLYSPNGRRTLRPHSIATPPHMPPHPHGAGDGSHLRTAHQPHATRTPTRDRIPSAANPMKALRRGDDNTRGTMVDANAALQLSAESNHTNHEVISDERPTNGTDNERGIHGSQQNSSSELDLGDEPTEDDPKSQVRNSSKEIVAWRSVIKQLGSGSMVIGVRFTANTTHIPCLYNGATNPHPSIHTHFRSSGKWHTRPWRSCTK